MPEKTKQSQKSKLTAKKVAEKNADTSDKGNWSEDQQKKSYYYDDSYGYEIYNPDEDDEEDEEVKSKKTNVKNFISKTQNFNNFD